MKRAMLHRWVVILGVALASSAVIAWLPTQPLAAAQGKKDKKGKKGEIVGDFRTVQGTVKEFTTAPKGEKDGCILNNGTFVHWPPHLADQFTGIAIRGDKVKVVGQERTGPEGDTKLEVSTLTNLRTGKTSRNEDLPAPKRLSDQPRSVEDRLQALENRMEELLQEIRALRRNK